MYQDSRHAGNVILLRGAALWLLMALALAWCLVGLSFGIPIINMIFKSFDRLLQAHIDFKGVSTSLALVLFQVWLSNYWCFLPSILNLVSITC